jgi:dTDP-4-amino-4,6-dideoxygalactose transaminase
MNSLTSSSLAVNGANPVRSKPWPRWPEYGPQATTLLEQVLERGRWAVSGLWTGEASFDQVFAKEFSRYLGVEYCIPTDHGSSALVIAMRALGIGAGDEVIVPGLTWVACPAAVLRVGAVPILVDIEPDTLCLSPEAVDAAITSRTAAIMVVHLYSAMAQMDKLIGIARARGIPIIEDSAQAHGARWRGHAAGTLTEVGTFSMQQTKVLTCGEGGAVVTSNARLCSLLEQHRNDGRRYSVACPELGHMHFEEIGDVAGGNYAMSEFQSALLLDGLSRLDKQNRERRINAQYLDYRLVELGGLKRIEPYEQNAERSYYYYVVRYEPSEFAGKTVDSVCKALEAELNFFVHPTYKPLNNHQLYRPHLSKKVADQHLLEKLDPAQFDLPEALRQHERAILIHHSALLGTQEDMDDIVAAFEKVKRLAHTIPDA